MIDELTGKTLDQTYRIDQMLGKGGMGAVYRARDINLNRDVAIKVMHRHYTGEEGFRARFLQEARAIAALDHPGIVKVYAFGQDLGLLYIVMDFIPGQSLHAWLKRLAQEAKIVALSESLRVVRRIAWALHYAHEKGVLHRDIKPANIMLKPTDPAMQETGDLPFHPVLTDFGLAKLAEGGVQTQTGTTMGTPAYMSPEQCLGYEPDRRSDIYALGVLLYELTTGQVPFQAKSLTEAIRMHTQEPPPPPRSIHADLPVQVENIILRALSKRKEDRYPTAKAMSDALQDAIPRVPKELTVAPTMAERPPQGPYVSLMTRLAEESAAPSAPGSDVWDAAPPASQLGATLIVVSPGGETRRISVNDGATLSVGRTPGNDVQLMDKGVSRHHARIEYDGNTFQVTDLNSTNGTYLGESRLLPGVSQPWPPGISLRVGGHWLRYEEVQSVAPSVLGPPSMASVPGRPAQSARPDIALESETVTVEAGQQGALRLRIRNQGTQVDHFTVRATGVPPTWVDTPREPLRLTPGEEEAATVTLHPPRHAQSTAGAHPIELHVASQADPNQMAETRGVLHIPPFHAFEAMLAPQQISKGRARLSLANQGNTPASMAVSGNDPAEALTIQATPAQVTLEPGQKQTLPIEAQTRARRPLLGTTQRYPFELSIATSVGEQLKRGGTLLVKPLIPMWVLPVLGVLLMLLCAGAGIGYTAYTRGQQATATAQTATAVAAVTLTATTDQDGDGLTDIEEARLGTDPTLADTDGDTLKDGDELEYKTDPTVADTDGDGLNDGAEIGFRADPLAIDSDGDTLPDGQEVNELGTSPINPDTDGDGLNDKVDPDPGQLPTPTPTPTDTPLPTETPTLTPTPTGTYTPAPTDTPTDVPTSTPTPTPTHTPTPTPTPKVGIIITLPPVIVTQPPLIITSIIPIQFRVAYIYGDDQSTAKDFEQLIEDQLTNTNVVPIKKSSVSSTDLSGYRGIVIGPDTGSGSSWNNASAVSRIKSSGKPVLGIGKGGASLFQDLGLEINWGHGASFFNEFTIYVLQPNHPIFDSPNTISVPGNRLIQIYNTASSATSQNASSLPKSVSRIARDDSQNYISIAQQGQHMFWSYDAGPDSMTNFGKQLFANTVSYLISQ